MYSNMYSADIKMAYRIVSLTVKILQFCCSFVVLLCAETPRAIILSNVMKCILERATQQFDKNLAEGMKVDSYIT